MKYIGVVAFLNPGTLFQSFETTNYWIVKMLLL